MIGGHEDRQLEIHLSIQAIRIEKRSSWILNELLKKTFGAWYFVDNKNQTIGEGIIGFPTKADAQLVLKSSQKCYILVA